MADGDAGAAAAAAAAAAASKPWYDGVPGVDPEIVGHWQNRGWDKKPAAEVALEATRAWKAAEGKLGVPADQLVRVPKDAADEAGWKALWTRLGAPADAKGYDFADVKRADGTAINEDFANTLRSAALQAHLPKDAAAAMTRAVVKYMEGEDSKKNAEFTAKLTEQRAALKTNWGPNEPAFMLAAQRAAAALGVDPAAVAALEKVVGYDKTMDMFLKIAQKIGEDKFITSEFNKTGAMTREQAQAKKADLMSNPQWRDSYLAGDKEKQREMIALQTIILGIAA